MEHSSKNDSIFKVALNLMGACLISGLIIGSLYTVTKDTAAAKQVEVKEAALKSMVAEADEYKEIEGKPEWFTAMKNGQVIAYIVPVENSKEFKAYGGTIELLVAVKPDHKVLKYIITESKETPGLGAKASEDLFAGQFVGKSAEELNQSDLKKFDPVTKTGEKGKINAISGSTITTRAVTSAVYEAVEKVAAAFPEGGH